MLVGWGGLAVPAASWSSRNHQQNTGTELGSSTLHGGGWKTVFLHMLSHLPLTGKGLMRFNKKKSCRNVLSLSCHFPACESQKHQEKNTPLLFPGTLSIPFRDVKSGSDSEGLL